MLTHYRDKVLRLLPFLLALLAALLTLSGLLLRLDFWLYDGLIRLKSNHNQTSDIVVVAVDERSLSELGRWPWPREYHAQLVDKLAQAKAVGLDIVLAEPSHNMPESDQALADAIRRNGKVISPVFPEMQGNRLTETRPLPGIAAASAGLGHTDYELDSDGVIRRVYLKAGLGSPHHPNFAQAVLDLAHGRRQSDQQKLGLPHGNPDSWLREDPVMVPYLTGSPPFQQVSYIDALNQLPPSFFAGKIVLVGATATGLGDIHATPLSANNRGMPGVEINAFLLYGLQQDNTPVPLPLGWKALINALAILLLDLLLCRYKHRQGILPAYLLASCGVLVLSVLLLTLASVFWSGVTTAILLWLAGSVRFVSRQSKLLLQANTDGLTGLYNRRHFDEILAPTLDKHRTAGKTLALLILDVDNFKGYNDHYGHYAGDLILQRLAQELNAYFSTRRHIVARLGGEEFGVLLEECGQDQAVAAAEGFRARLEELELPHLKSPLRKVTCSIGVAARVPETDDNGRTFYEDADSALYIAKRSGRNAVSPAPDTLTPQHLR